MKKTASTVLCILACAGLYAASAIPSVPAWRGRKNSAGQSDRKEFAPQVQDNTITFGPKKLKLEPNGQLVCSDNNGQVLFRLKSSFWAQNLKTKKTEWGWTDRHLDKEKSSLKLEGNKFVWKLVYTVNGKSFPGLDLALEILPGGKLRYTSQTLFPDEFEGLKLIYGSTIITFPQSAWNGTDMVFDGKKIGLNIDNGFKATYPWPHKNQEIILAPGDATQEIRMNGVHRQDFNYFAFRAYKEFKAFRITVYAEKRTSPCSFELDLRHAGTVKASSAGLRAGSDFMALENLEMPDYSHKNLIINPSFERKYNGYNSVFRTGTMKTPDRYKAVPIALDTKEKVFGSHSLRFRTMKRFGWKPLTGWEDREKCIDENLMQIAGVNIRLQPLVLEQGKYTLSFYAKAAPDAKSPVINVWVPDFLKGRDWGYRPADRKWFFITKEWKRYVMLIDAQRTQPVSFGINATAEQPTDVWIDGIQLEKGDQATEFAAPPAEGKLETSDEDNFVSDKVPLNARMVVTAAPGSKGKMKILVRNFFHETVLEKTSDFTAGADGTAVIPLPELENAGRGIFMVRTDYTLSDGRKCFDQTRFVRAAFLENKHPRANLYTFNYGNFTTHSPYTERFLTLLRKCGYGGSFGHLTRPLHDETLDLLEKYGYQEHEALMGTPLSIELGPYKVRMAHYGLSPLNVKSMKRPDPRFFARTYGYPFATDPEVLIGDHNMEKCEPDEAFFKRYAAAVEKIARDNPRIKLWGWAGEIRSKFPNAWWHKSGREEDASRVHAMYLKAFVEGVRKGNPKAKVYQDDPCNMTPDGGIAETEMLLKNTNKMGVRFDVIAIHPYRFSPEEPDLDADTAAFVKMLDRVGYGKTPIIWPEMMHWGPYNLPQWGTVSSSWSGTPVTWPGYGLLSYDMGWTEKVSAAWIMRSWLVALKYDGRISHSCSGGINNTFLDDNMTPTARLLAPNVLGHLLGDAKFQKDIRFAPYVRAYVFEDAQKRPVAAVWCHMPDVDAGRIDPPVAEADFGNTLEGVYDMMYSPREFNKNGKTRFAVTSFPLFFRGKPGTLGTMIKAFGHALIVTGEGIAPVSAAIAPARPDKCAVKLTNFVSMEQKGTLNGVPVAVPASGTARAEFPLAPALGFDRIRGYHLPMIFKTEKSRFDFDFKFEAAAVKRLPDNAGLETADWSKLPSIPFTRNTGKKETEGSWKLGWNTFGLFLEVRVRDAKYVHRAFEDTRTRWNNDCLQIYIDTMADARGKKKGYDDNDYDYAMFPNPDGKSAVMWRYYTPDMQLTLGTAAPKNNTLAQEIPCTFSSKDGVLTYRVFFPARYVLPIRLQKGTAFGFGLYVPNVDKPDGKVTSALTTAADGRGCFRRPDTWPIMLLTE